MAAVNYVLHVCPPGTSHCKPFSLLPGRQADTHHYSIYNIVTVVLQGTDCLRSGHIRLRHHQLNVFHFDAGFVNLKETEPGTDASPTHGLLHAWRRKMGLSGLGRFPLGPHRAKLGGQTGYCPALGQSPGSARDQILLGEDPALSLCHHRENVDEGKKTTGLNTNPGRFAGRTLMRQACSAAAGSGLQQSTQPCRDRLGKAYLFFLALLLHGGGLCVFLDV